VETLQSNTGAFHDRSYHFNSLGDFTGKTFIKYDNDDKMTDHIHVMTKLRTMEPTTVYVVKQTTNGLPWLEQFGFERVARTGVTFTGQRSTRHKEWDPSLLTTDSFDASEVFSKTYAAGTISLPGNGEGDGSFLIFMEKAAAHTTPGPATLLSGAAHCPQCTCAVSATDPHWSNAGCDQLFDDVLLWSQQNGIHMVNGNSLTLYFPQPVWVDSIVLQQAQLQFPRYVYGDVSVETFANGAWSVQGHIDDLPREQFATVAPGGVFTFPLATPVMTSKVRMTAGSTIPRTYRMEELQVYGRSA